MNRELMSRLLAAVLLSPAFAALLTSRAHKALSLIESDPSQYLANERQLYSRSSFGSRMITALVLFIGFVLLIEVLAYLLRKIVRPSRRV